MNQDNVAKFLKELRTEKGLTQEKLADEICVSRTLVNKWEKGKVALTIQNLQTLSEYYNVTSNEILAGEKLNKDNKEQIKNIKYEIYNENNKIKKKFKIFIIIFVIFIIMFLFYYFITFINSVKINDINSTSEDITLSNSILFKTADRIYLQLQINSENINSINLYYEDNGKKNI